MSRLHCVLLVLHCREDEDQELDKAFEELHTVMRSARRVRLQPSRLRHWGCCCNVFQRRHFCTEACKAGIMLCLGDAVTYLTKHLNLSP